MTDRIKRIEALEKELSQLGILKDEGKDLESICTSINSRICSLKKLKNELSQISGEMYYYDMIDYLGNVPCKHLTLRECIALLNDLVSAKNKFESDSDHEYLVLCQKIKDKVILIGLKCCENNFKNSFLTDEIANFYELSSLETRYKIEKLYFANRKRSLASKISECAIDLRKNYRLLLIGEMQCYKKMFNKDALVRYKEMEFLKDKSPDFDDFVKFIYGVLCEIFKKIKSKILKEILTEITPGSLGSDDAALNGILINSAIAYFGSEQSDELKASIFSV